jgi:hypothetical protein
MSEPQLDQDRLACSPMGHLEYVVESERDGRTERWFILRPRVDLASTYAANGSPLAQGCRVVVEANSLRPVGVLPGDARVPARIGNGSGPK